MEPCKPCFHCPDNPSRVVVGSISAEVSRVCLLVLVRDTGL